MAWNPDDPFLPSAALGETDSGARNLPGFLCSLLHPGPVLVLGASEVVLEAARRHEVVAVDWSSRRLAQLDEVARARGLAVRTMTRNPDTEELGVPRRGFANAVCLDGLERFRNDVRVLEQLHGALAPEGQLILRVRSCPWVREEASRLPAEPRQYGPDSLRDALEEAGFRTTRMRHWNLIGVPAAFVWDRCLGRPHRDEGGVPWSERPRHWWDAALDLWYRNVENRVGFPSGVSLIATATPYLEKARIREGVHAEAAARGRRTAYEPTAFSSSR